MSRPASYSEDILKAMAKLSEQLEAIDARLARIENAGLKVVRGEKPYGTSNGRAKLSEDQVLEILLSPKTGKELARLYGVHKSTIHNVRQGRAWPHLYRTLPYNMRP